MFVQPNANSKFTCSTVQKTPPRAPRSSPSLSNRQTLRRGDFELDATVGGMGREEEQKKGQTETELALSITVHGAINFRRRRYCFLCRSIFAICRRPSHRTHHHPQWFRAGQQQIAATILCFFNFLHFVLRGIILLCFPKVPCAMQPRNHCDLSYNGHNRRRGEREIDYS